MVTNESEYENDDHGRTTHTVFSYYIEDYSTGERTLSSEYEFYNEYDEDGNLTYRKYISSSGGTDGDVSITESNYEYEFDENGDMSKQYEYDAGHNLVGWTEYEYEPCGTQYEYYPDGSLKGFYKSYSIDNDDGGFTHYYDGYDAGGSMESSSITTYDSDGNRIKYQYYSGSDNVLISEENYTYDSEGRMTSGKLTTYYLNNPEEYIVSGEYELMQIYVWHSFDEK